MSESIVNGFISSDQRPKSTVEMFEKYIDKISRDTHTCIKRITQSGGNQVGHNSIKSPKMLNSLHVCKKSSDYNECEKDLEQIASDMYHDVVGFE